MAGTWALQTLQPLDSQAWGICVGRWVQGIQQGRPPVGRSLAGEHQLAARASRPAAGGWSRPGPATRAVVKKAGPGDLEGGSSHSRLGPEGV